MLPTTLVSSQDMGDSTPDEDQGVIRCICKFEDDDGFTIQCENCLVWQHAVCVNIDQDNVPDEYLCEQCNSRKLDVE
ncbi:SET domain-containing protein 3, partial [Coemansia brasiliensis]